MTRRSKLALVTLLAGLLSLVPVSAVTADSGCTGYAPEHCEQMATANDAALFRITAVASPVHPLSSNGIARENYEQVQFLEQNTITLPEVNTIVPVSTPSSYMEQVTPRSDQPR